MTDQQAPERIWICRRCGEVDVCDCPYDRQSYAPTDLLEAAEKRADELVAENITVHERAKKAEAERDQALAAVGAVIEMMPRPRCAECDCEKGGEDCTWIKHGPNKYPDATAALNEMLADAWGEGWVAGRSGVRADRNPYRKATNEGEA